MGGSGGSAFPIGPTDIDELRRRANEIADQASFDAEVNEELAKRLAAVNARDVERIRGYLDDALDALKDAIDDVERTLFGGSVSKGTYVEGLSDVDALVVLREVPEGATPREVLEQFRQTLEGRLNHADVASVDAGALAVTVTYRDGTEIQLLPAIHRDDRTAISSGDGTEWKAIHPRRFAQALTDLNAAQGRAVVPAIKLAKAVIGAQMGEGSRPSGYHVEALALAAFKDYNGSRNTKAMLTHFFAEAARGVLKPIKDISGQSHHVDERLGNPNSGARQALSRDLQRIADTMERSKGISEWRRLLGDA
jgi:predicted nucleotidyltransferase